MSEIKYVTTTGNFGSLGGAPIKPSNPVVPTVDEGWVVTMVGSAAADGMLFWFWMCAPPVTIPEKICHWVTLAEGNADKNTFALCNKVAMEHWPPGEQWSDDPAKITCPNCLAAMKEKKSDAVR